MIKNEKLIEYDGQKYFDDRLFVLYLCKGVVEEDQDGLISTKIYHNNEQLKKYVWCLVTYRNCRRYPAVRVDSFYEKESAMQYLRKIEPTVPLISLGGKSMDSPMSYEEYLNWKNNNNFKEYNWREMYSVSGIDGGESEIFFEDKKQFRGIR